MKIVKGSWIHQLYVFGCSGIRSRDRKNNEISVWTFGRRVVLSAIFVAYVSTLKLLGLCIFAILFEVPAVILTVLANVVTIPLGFGVSILYPGEKFLKIPFQVSVGRRQMNFAWLAIPYWIVVINILFLLFYEHVGDMISGMVWLYSFVALVAYGQAINFAKKSIGTVVFVDSLEKRDESMV